MGRQSRTVLMPDRLGEKLLEIRNALGLSQSALVDKLGNFPTIDQSIISAYELGKREPPSLLLLAYARLANVYVDVLIDDALDLPAVIPPKRKSAGITNLETP